MQEIARKRLSSVLVALTSMAMPALAADTCPAERALYALEGDEGRYELGFVPAQNYASIASDLYLFLTTPQRTYWFTFSVSNGYSGMTLLPVSDPTRADARPDGPKDLLELGSDEPADVDVLRALRFYALDADFTFWEAPPNAGENAPDLIMMPEIGLALWYSAASLTDDPAADRDPMPRGVFEPDVCLGEDRERAWP